jgi:hypothetical protein
MRKKFLISMCITLAVGLIYTPLKAKAQVVSKSTDHISADNKSIAYNKVNFNVISQDNAPETLIKKIELYKDKEGFVSYSDSSSGKSYIAIMRGEKPTTGYGITVNSIDDSEGSINILIQETDPNESTVSPQIITYPYIIIETSSPLPSVNVKNSNNKNYSYYDIQKNLTPIIGVSWTSGNLKNIYKEDSFIFLEVENTNGISQFFYVNDNEDGENKIKNLNLNTSITVKYALGTPQKYKDNSSFPLTEIILPIDKSSFTDANWEDLEPCKNVDNNRQWLLSYDKELMNENINSSNIYVSDKNGFIIPTEASLTEDKKSIKIVPSKPYNLGENYYLFITKNVTSNIKPSVKGFRLKFQISNEISAN